MNEIAMPEETMDFEAARAEFASIFSSRFVAAELEPSPKMTQRIMGAVAHEAARTEFASMLSTHFVAAELEPSPEMAQRIVKAVTRMGGGKSRLRLAGIAACFAGVSLATSLAHIYFNFRPKTTLTASNVAASNLPRIVGFTDSAADWLVSQQEPSGAWSPAQTGGNEAFRPALTALAMMALQRHAPIRHADAITRAAMALESMQQSDGSFSSAVSSKLYNHAFATYALLEHNAISQNAKLSETLRRAVAFSLRSQNRFGAWDYTETSSGNTALTVWQVGLLMKARRCGWQDSEGQMRRALAWLCRQGRDGFFHYRDAPSGEYAPHSGSLTLTAMATATLMEAAQTFPELKGISENAASALAQACAVRGEDLPDDHYRDYFLGKIYATNDDAAAQRDLTDRIAARHHTASRTPASPPWVASDVWSTTGGDLYATVMAMLSVNRT